MRYFWHFTTAVGVLGGILVLFFIVSLNWGDNISYTEEKLTEPTVTIADPSLGPADAPVTIVNFGDYQCDECANMEETLATVAEDFPDQLRIVWKDMPNTSLHPEALNAALAARCAGEQDKFWDYHTYLFANQDALSDELYTTIATELDLRERAFANCMEDQETAPLVQRTYEEGLALDLTGTPTIYINGERYTGAVDVSTLKSVIRTYIH